MINNLRSLLSVPALAIAAMACTTTSVDAQCLGGCFGYPTPTQPTFQAYAPAVQYQSVEVAPVQTFVQPQVFVAPKFVSPQPFVQAPLQQTFVSQPTIIESGFASVPQGFSQPVYLGLPADAYNVQPILPTQAGVPVQQSPAVDAGVVIPPVTEPMADNPVDDVEESVQEGQIEGEIISPADTSVLENDSANEILLTAAAGLAAEEEAKEPAMKKAAMEKAAMEKAELKKAVERKAAMERAAAREAAKEEATQKKSGDKVPTVKERIVNLEKSQKRQVKRAQQVSKRELSSKLKELKADDATDAAIETAKQEAATALEAKIAAITKRVQARIRQLEN